MKNINIVIQSTKENVISVMNTLGINRVEQANAKRFYFQYREIDHDLRVKFSSATTALFGVPNMAIENRDDDIQLIFKFEVDDEDYNDFINTCTENGNLDVNKLMNILVYDDVLADYNTSFSARTISRINDVIANNNNNNNVPNAPEQLQMEAEHENIEPQNIANEAVDEVEEGDAVQEHDRQAIRRPRRGRVGRVIEHDIEEAQNVAQNVIQRPADNRQRINVEELNNIWTLQDLINLYHAHNIPLNEVSVNKYYTNQNFRGNTINIFFD